MGDRWTFDNRMDLIDKFITCVKKTGLPAGVAGHAIDACIAYKVLAAGAIHPRDGFKYGFENGADFVCVGMFDWQVAEDAMITNSIVVQTKNRQRAWMA